MAQQKSWLRRLKETVLTPKAYIRHQGVVLPPRHRRFCGEEFRDDAYYLRSAEGEARRLVDRFGCGEGSRLMDVGCGQGRLAIGLLRVVGDGLRYTGVDVDAASVDWCRQYIQSEHPSYRFHHLDLANERYNREGQPISETFRFDWPDASFDIIYLYSVFSHMEEADMRRYLAEFHRLLGEGGRVFFTTFVEENVPDFSVNPPGYVFATASGPLHVVRFEKQYLFNLLQEYGFEVSAFTYGDETNGQSGLYLRKITE